MHERTQVDPAQLQRIERDAGLMMAGERNKISMHPRKVITIEHVDEHLRRRISVPEVPRNLGVERTTIYRLLRTRRRASASE